MFILRQTSVKMAVLLHKQAKVPFILIIAVYMSLSQMVAELGLIIKRVLFSFLRSFGVSSIQEGLLFKRVL